MGSTARTLGLEDEAHGLGRLVAHIAQQRRFFLLDQLGELLHQTRLLHLIGDFGDDDLVAASAGVLPLPPSAQPEAAAARLVSLQDRLARLHDDATGRKVRPGHELDQLLDGRIGMLDEMQERRAQLLGIVRWDVGRHADGDARGAVGQQIGKGRRENRRLSLTPIVVGPKINGVFVYPFEQLRRCRRQTGFRVAFGRRIITIDIAEIALAVDQRVAHGEVLSEAGKCVVDRLVAVRVVVAHRLADDLCTLAVAPFRVEAQLAHGIEYAPVNRLQAVAHIRQRPVHDGGERISQIALFQRYAQRHGLYGAGAR